MSDALPPWPALDTLRRYADARRQASSAERCEFCGAEIPAEHGHLVNVATRSLLCVCRSCYLLFTHDGAGGASFRAVPDRYELVTGSSGIGQEWDALQIPIGLAFFFRNSATGRVTAFYPSPAGATESELALDTWDDLVQAAPALRTLAADVEALLARRTPTAPARVPDGEPELVAAIVPIDICYELVGRIRRGWRGFQGSDDMWREIDVFFDRIVERARGAITA